jgi:hypothetical protein
VLASVAANFSQNVCTLVCPFLQILGRVPVLELDVRANSDRTPLNVFDPLANKLGTVSQPVPKPDHVILGWLIPFNSVTTTLNGVSFRGEQRYEIWRRAIVPYELRWIAAWLSVSDCLLVLK